MAIDSVGSLFHLGIVHTPYGTLNETNEFLVCTRNNDNTYKISSIFGNINGPNNISTSSLSNYLQGYTSTQTNKDTHLFTHPNKRTVRIDLTP